MKRQDLDDGEKEELSDSPVERNLKRIFGQMSFEKSNVYEAGTRNDGEENMDRLKTFSSKKKIRAKRRERKENNGPNYVPGP
ncbi:MAG: hypothetical protein VX794_02630 [Nitrospinota bacterium]|nr:hypothetical protein [Nitrospinota bacterium]